MTLDKFSAAISITRWVIARSVISRATITRTASWRTRLLPALLSLLSAVLVGAPGAVSAQEPPELLVFSKTAEFRHSSIPAGVRMLRELGEAQGFGVVHSEDSSVFDDGLSRFAAVVFLSTTGDVLNEAQQRSFERYIGAGGAFVGIHSASDTEHDWPWFGELVGAYFHSHPRIQSAFIVVEDREHPSTRMLPERWERVDEWYNFRRNPRGHVHVLMTLDASSFQGSAHGNDHPIAWCHEHDGGRAWYTGLGHTIESFAEPLFREHVLGGIRWAIGDEDADCVPPAQVAAG